MILSKIETAYHSLSKQQKKLAEYIMENYVDIAFMGIVELSNHAGISAATITRFVKNFGYATFADFQRELVQLAKNEIVPVKEYQFNVRYYPGKDDLTDQIEEAKEALDIMYSSQLNTVLQKASNTLVQAKTIYILGSRTSFAAAYYLYFSLKRVKGNVRLIENRNEDLSIELQYITKEDVLLSISYPQYTKNTVKIYKYFKERGCATISITDRIVSPIAQGATHLILVKNKLKTYLITIITIINALLVMIGHMNPDINIAAFREENEVTSKLDIYSDE